MKFVSVFGPPISQSAPHIYLSALPFAPKNSLVAKQYLRLYPNSKTLCLKTGKANRWPASISVFWGHNLAVNSVAFSQDSKRIVSGLYDETIRVWNAETGEVVVGPLEGHTVEVNSVAFSQDSKRIVSGSYDRTIRVWDAETGDVVVDSKRIVSGSYDHTIRVWDAEIGKVVVGDHNLANSFTDTSTLVDGWICNSSSKPLFWVPTWNRAGLCWPRNHFVIALGLHILIWIILYMAIHGSNAMNVGNILKLTV